MNTQEKSKKRPRGRPAKITEEIIKRLCSSIRAGNWNGTACAYAGISTDTLNEWVKRGRKEYERLGNPRAKENVNEILYLLLYNSYDKAIAEAEVRGVANICKAASGGGEITEIKEVFDAHGNLKERTTKKSHAVPQWTAQAWLLERRYPDRWSRRIEIGHGDGVGPEKRMSPEDFIRKCQDAAAKMLSFDPQDGVPVEQK